MKNGVSIHQDQSTTFCVLPWTNLYVANNGEAYTCYEATGHEPIGTLRNTCLDKIINSEKSKEIRQLMMDNKQVSQCEKCYINEKASKGVPSLRQLSNHHNQELVKQIFNKEFLGFYHLDINLSNKCNLKCRICNSKYSHLWIEDELALEGQSLVQSKTTAFATKFELDLFLNSLDLRKIKSVIFAGGEPYLDDRIIEILEILKKNECSPRIYVNTNCSLPKMETHPLTLLLKQFEDVHVSLSLDGHDRYADYMRKGSHWNEVKANVNAMNMILSKKVIVHCTVSLLNIFILNDFFSSLLDQTNLKPWQIELNPLYTPQYYNIQILTNEQKEMIQNRLNHFIKKYLLTTYDLKECLGLMTQIKNIISYMFLNEHNATLLEQFKLTTELLDLRRNESFNEIYGVIY